MSDHSEAWTKDSNPVLLKVADLIWSHGFEVLSSCFFFAHLLGLAGLIQNNFARCHIWEQVDFHAGHGGASDKSKSMREQAKNLTSNSQNLLIYCIDPSVSRFYFIDSLVEWVIDCEDVKMLQEYL